MSSKAETIQNDKLKFRTQIVDGKPQIFFEDLDGSGQKSRPKRNSRSINQTQSFRQTEQQKLRVAQQKTTDGRIPQQNQDKRQIKDDGSNMGVYMTMDELSELVKAVKENAKKETESSPPRSDPLPTQPAHPPIQYQEPAAPVVPKLDLGQNGPTTTTSGHISPREQALSIMADKKRQKWQRERAEVERLQMEIQYDQLKQQLSPKHKKNSVSPERSTFQYDFPANGKPPQAQVLQPNMRINDVPAESVSRMDGDNANRDLMKTRLMEKKQQQWRQEQTEKLPDWNPFGRPGAGAPNPVEMSARPTPAPNLNNTQQRVPTSFGPPASYVQNDQLRVPAAMRTNLVFGNNRTEDDVRAAKELERRQWLEDLQKQVEENKRKKIMGYETDRRKDFLHENVQPLLQEAANRHNGNFRTTNGQDYVENQEGRSTVLPGNQRSGEKLFGPNYETGAKINSNTHLDILQMNGILDAKHQYRANDTRRDEAVNTVVTTFRSEHTSQSKNGYNGHANEDSDLPPYASNARHLQTRRNGRMNSNEENSQGRRTTSTKTVQQQQQQQQQQNNYHFDGTTYQLNGQRQVPINERPLWNYKNPKHREYVPNSKRDPHYEKRQRLKHFEQGNFDRIDDVQKKVCYNRWNSDSDLQENSKKAPSKSRVRSTNSKATGLGGTRKDESILNLLKAHQRQQANYGMRKASSYPVRPDDDYQSNRASSPDKDENLSTYQQGDDRQDLSPTIQSRDSSPHKSMIENRFYDDSQERVAENPTRSEPYQPPVSRQDHILQQLSTIRENLIRRQRELAT